MLQQIDKIIELINSEDNSELGIELLASKWDDFCAFLFEKAQVIATTLWDIPQERSLILQDVDAQIELIVFKIKYIYSTGFGEHFSVRGWDTTEFLKISECDLIILDSLLRHCRPKVKDTTSVCFNYVTVDVSMLSFIKIDDILFAHCELVGGTPCINEFKKARVIWSQNKTGLTIKQLFPSAKDYSERHVTTSERNWIRKDQILDTILSLLSSDKEESKKAAQFVTNNQNIWMDAFNAHFKVAARSYLGTRFGDLIGRIEQLKKTEHIFIHGIESLWFEYADDLLLDAIIKTTGVKELTFSNVTFESMLFLRNEISVTLLTCKLGSHESLMQDNLVNCTIKSFFPDEVKKLFPNSVNFVI